MHCTLQSVWINVAGLRENVPRETCPHQQRTVYQSVKLSSVSFDISLLAILLEYNSCVWEESLSPSGLELGRDVLITGARVIQLIGAILPRAVSLVIGLVGDMGGGWQTAACVAAQFAGWSHGLSSDGRAEER